MIRPEAMALIRRYREALFGALLGLPGLYWAMTSWGALQIIGGLLAVLGGIFVAAGLQRARFRTGAQGAGVVKVTEGQITYFGPISGGVVAQDLLSSLAIAPGLAGAEWELAQPGQPPMTIPVDALGAEALIDVFARLPGLSMERMLGHLGTPPPSRTVIWERAHNLLN